MAQTRQSRGACAFCGKDTTKGTMTKHIQSCPQRIEALEKAEAKAKTEEVLLYIRVQDAYDKRFWLDLEMRGDATLKKLDDYLRAIWLECCGHLSEFSLGGWGSAKIGKAQTAVKAFGISPILTHIYDFGTSSETTLTLIGFRRGAPLSKHPIFLMARNVLPQEQCARCDQPAAFLCMENFIQNDESGLLCPTHAEEFEDSDYGPPVPVVNSPRLGMCGYDGPAKPPY